MKMVIYETPISDTQCATVGCPDAGAPFWTDYGPTPQQLAQAIMGPGFAVNNVTYNGHPMARGTFGNGYNANLPLDKGIILCTGYITDAEGSNENYDGFSVNLKRLGDADLNKVIAPYITHDAAILEFDVTSSSSTITFNYFFASEEYPNWQNQYDDVTAIFVDGTNTALVPVVSKPISVYTVNSSINSQYYQFNPTYPIPATVPLFNFSYNGLTTLLTAQTSITPNVPHHVKIAIADAADGAWDSAIFLKASISCP